MSKLLILGAGYTGKVVAERVKGNFEIIATTRSGDPRFDLADESSWSFLEREKELRCLWTFPATPHSLVQKFLDLFWKKSIAHLVVIGSTGAYLATEPDQMIDETHQPDLSDARVEGEEEIRQRGGIVLRAAGIYGPDRLPIRWLESGRVAPSERYVNFIHISDLADLCLAALKLGKPGATYLASDDRPHRWKELADIWTKEFDLKIPTSSHLKKDQPLSKRIDSSRSREELKISLRFPSVVHGVRDLLSGEGITKVS